MLLSEIVGKNVYSGKAVRGICRGVCLSLKSRAVKYLLCSREPAQNDYTEFSVGVNCIDTVAEKVFLKRLRPAVPKNCVRFFTGRPIYSEEGLYLGITADLVMEEFTAKINRRYGKNLFRGRDRGARRRGNPSQGTRISARRARNFGYSRKTDPYPRGYAGHPRNPEGRDCLGTAHPFDNRASPRARRHRGRLAFQSAYLAVILRMAERQSFRSRISFAVRRFLVA